MHLTNDPGLWQHFVNRPDNVGRPIMEVKQKYLTEINAFESSVNAMSAGDSGAGGGTAPIPSIIPVASPAATPAASPEASPAATPAATPGATPAATPAATPGATPAASPPITPTPSVS